MVAPAELVRELLYYRDMKMVSGRDWAFITAMIAGGSIAFPVLAPIALGSIVALGVGKLRELQRRRTMVGVDLPVPSWRGSVEVVVGAPRRFRGTVQALAEDAAVLHQHIVVRDDAQRVLIRRSVGAPFLLDRADGERVLVTGAMRLVGRKRRADETPDAHIDRHDRRLRAMGVPASFAIAGRLETLTVVEDDAPLAIIGVLEEEAVAELAFHRDGGTTRVMRGVAGAPLLAMDPGLVGDVAVPTP